ncbi:hypothetical protein [Longimicrobium sp.]|uniref:hypothetical protein n=1 Tax=Longimicrobium sp. TaxID=2029185 RepID=UPI002B71B4E7|nr:hypothetical protein [Longimicrobium sp.]HSU13726.1 hypothetical protein [Longimicrobium sp.]
MIELRNDVLAFSFPDVHADARVEIELQRTLRIPDDGRDYPLPPGLGRFPLRHVDDFAGRLPAQWGRHGGVMLPMYQAEALWLSFRSPTGFPFAVKVATGKINAVTGESWRDGLNRHPQDYVTVPGQPWLDGYCVEKGYIRQFVAMPLGAGYTAEEQITGEAEHGGLQLAVYPMKREAWERIVAERTEMARRMPPAPMFAAAPAAAAALGMEMGLGAGGRMRQSIYDDRYTMEDWDLRVTSRCFIHIANSLVWRSITGTEAPTAPPTAEAYTRAGLPWFDYYAENRTAVEGSGTLARLKSIFNLGKEKGDVPLPENQSVETTHVVGLKEKPTPETVREGTF